jgi:hypothetical protein
MKKLALALALSAVASVAQAQIANGPHDFTNGWTGSTATTATVGACTFCHAPHNANSAIANAPLWNRATNVGPYTMYPTGGTIRGAIQTAPGANSLTCLACHDGVQSIAVTFANGNVATGGTEAARAPAAMVVSTDLRNDHPIAITYDSAANAVRLRRADQPGRVRLLPRPARQHQRQLPAHAEHHGALLRLPHPVVRGRSLRS